MLNDWEYRVRNRNTHSDEASTTLRHYLSTQKYWNKTHQASEFLYHQAVESDQERQPDYDLTGQKSKVQLHPVEVYCFFSEY